MAVNNIQNANFAMWRELNHSTGVDAVHERGVARFEPPIRPGFRISPEVPCRAAEEPAIKNHTIVERRTRKLLTLRTLHARYTELMV